MMRWTGGIATGLAVVFLGPALLQPLRVGLAAGRNEDPASKQRAIAEVEEIAANLRQGSREAALRLLDTTEPPILDSGGRDARIESLRAEVDGLQRRFDAAAAREPSKAGALGRATPYAQRDEVTRTLDGGASTRLASTSAHASPHIERPATGYSADPLRQAVACIRAGQHQRALDVLDRLDAGAAREYWRGKALEALGRSAQALACYDKAAELGQQSMEGELARTDAEYLRWRAGLTSPAASTPAATAASAPAPASKEQHR